MSLAELFYFKCFRQAQASGPRRRRISPRPRKLLFEALEPRLLLSGDVHLVPAIIPDGTVWKTGDIQLLDGEARVPQKATLTVEPEAIVKGRTFSTDALIVEGTVHAGTPGQPGPPTVFTSGRDDSAGGDTNNDGLTTGANGDWGGLEFTSTSSGNFLDNVEVRFAGRGGTAAVGDDGGALALTNSVIRNSSTAGVRIQTSDPTLISNAGETGASEPTLPVISSLDSARILQEVVGIDRPEIPPLPGALTLMTGADPFVNLPTTLSGTPGSTVTAPVMIDNAAGLESVDLQLNYDATVLEVLAVRTGSVTPGGTLITNPTPVTNAAGTITVGLALTTPRPAGGGSLIEIDYRIRPTATSGTTALNLTSVSLNKGGLVLTPAPNPGADATDGRITIVSSAPSANTAPVAVDDVYVTDEDKTLTIGAPGVLLNDTDADGDTLMTTKRVSERTTHGVVTLNADGSFIYTPDQDFNGTDTFKYRANDGKVDSLNEATVTIAVRSVNDAPVGTATTVTTLEDTPYTFARADFGFTDPHDTPPNAFQAVKIATLPGAGTLRDNGTAVAAGQFVSVADITAGQFVFTPAVDANGLAYTSFTFQVQDNGGTANGGVDVDPTPRQLTVNVTAVNDAPVGTPKTVTTFEDTPYTFARADFGFSDPHDTPANGFQAVKVATLPGTGTLSVLGAAVVAGQFVSVGDLDAGRLVFAPAADANGTPYASFTFQVQDNGGTANGGVDLDPTPRALTVNVTPVNDAPVGTATTVTTLEDTAYTFARADFGFTDPHDSPANQPQAVKITTLPAPGTLRDNGTTVTPGQFVSVGDIDAGRLVFTPAADANGAPYASFTFQVQDDGGIANGGVDLDPTPRLLTINVAAVNDAPVGTATTVTTFEDMPYTFVRTDFGFTDPHDSPTNQLQAVRITTLPLGGTLRDNGTAVTAGQFVSVADITAGRFVFTPAPDANSSAYASFTFQVQDNGGTANGGVDLDPTPRLLTVNVTAVNDAPIGTATTVTTLEDTPYTFVRADFGFTDPHDSPANGFQAVRITRLPLAGMLKDNGTTVTAGQFVSVGDIDAGRLVFTPAADANGTPYANLTFQVQDDGGTGNGGVDLDSTPRTLTVNVTAVNDAPVGTPPTVTTFEDTPYTFARADFGFTDPHDSPPDAFQAVKITTLPGTGTLRDNGTAVTAGQFVSVGDLDAKGLVFTPAADANGLAYASFTFQVQDNGGTANGGVDLDPTPRALTVNVTPVNDAPVGTATTVTTLEDTPYTFARADFGFTDPHDTPPNAFQAVKITTLPGTGTLSVLGAAVVAGQFVSVGDLDAGRLVFAPAADANGTPYASFTFQVQDNGGTANGGVDLDPTPRALTVNVTPVNDAPVGTATTVTTLEDTPYTFARADFGFTDPHDSPANGFQAVRITTLPVAGALSDNGTAVTAGQFVSVGDIDAGRLKFTPAADANGTPYANLTFQVQDDGGTANEGVDLDPTPRLLTVNVTAVNDAPVGTPTTVTTFEDTPYTFVRADFGFTDPHDSPANNPQAVKITTVPAAGTLRDNGTAVTAGQFLSVDDIDAGRLMFTPAADATGAPYASFTFQVQDDGGTANGGVNLDPMPRALTVNVTAVNDAPVGTPTTVTTFEDAPYTFVRADFGFTDPHDSPANQLQAVRITTLPGAGTLTDNGTAITAGQFVTVGAIDAGRLVFRPAADANGTPYASFTFQVQDDGGTANGGVDLDPTPRSLTVNVISVNDAPVGIATTVSTPEDTAYVFGRGDFGFTDPHDSPANQLQAVRITTLPGAGALSDNGTVVTAGQFVSVGDIDAGRLVFTPVTHASGTPYASFTFQVQDNGGTANGGLDLDPTPRVLTVNVTPAASARIQIIGTEGDDRIQLVEENGVLTVTVNGVTQIFTGLSGAAVSAQGVTQTSAGVQGIDVFGLGGNDRIILKGLTIPVLVDAGDGNDRVDASGVKAVGVTLLGGAGNDVLKGGAGADVIDGGPGNDRIIGNGGNDTLRGGEGNDIFVWHDGDGNDSIDGGGGTDTVKVELGDKGDVVQVNADATRVTVSRSNLTPFVLELTTIERLILDAEDGADRIVVKQEANSPLTAIVIDAGDGNDVVDASAVMSARLTIFGGRGDDTLIGGHGNDYLNGGSGNDRLVGGPGNDVLVGGRGSDVLDGGAGDDVLIAGGNDDDRREGDRERGEHGRDEREARERDHEHDTLIGGGGHDIFINGRDRSRDVATTLLRDERRIPTRDDDLIDWRVRNDRQLVGTSTASSWLPRFVIDPGEDDLGANAAIAVTIASPAVVHRRG